MTFLEQLQQSAGLLGQQIQNVEPFGVYTPTESDYIQGVAQNRFVGNQFQMPNLGQSVHGGTQYTGMGTGMGTGVGTGMGTGTYTPGVFGSHYQSETGIPVGVTYPNGLINQGQGGGRDTNVTPREMSYQNRAFGDLGDRFTFSRDLDFGQAFDEFGRRRNIGPTLQGALQELGNFVTGGGIVGNAVKSLLGMDDETVTPETLQSLENRAEQASLAEEASQARQQLANISGVNRSQVERDRDARNRGRGFSGRGTSDPGGQAARGV